MSRTSATKSKNIRLVVHHQNQLVLQKALAVIMVPLDRKNYRPQVSFFLHVVLQEEVAGSLKTTWPFSNRYVDRHLQGTFDIPAQQEGWSSLDGAAL